MAIRMAKRMGGMKASEIRELLKLTQKPEVISFAGGLPASELFPVKQMRDAACKVFDEMGAQALQYATTEGYAPLRENIVRRLGERFGIRAEPDDVLITSGSQQGLDLTGLLFLDPGDGVLCESPTYLGAIQAFRAYEPRFIEVPTDDEGMIPEELERILQTQPGIKLAYVIPDFQNPSGRTWSLERRKAFLKLMREHQLPVIEDAPYSELRYSGEPIPPMKALDTTGQVIYLGTFSKLLCPGLRVAWIVAERSIREKYVLAKQGADLHTNGFAQRHIQTFLEAFDLEANIAKLCRAYGERRDVMLKTMDECFPKGLMSWTRPHGGMFLWVTMPDGWNARQVLERSLKENVAFVPGGSFFPNGGNEHTCRMNYSAMPPERIAEGVRRLGKVMESMAAETGVAAD